MVSGFHVAYFVDKRNHNEDVYLVFMAMKESWETSLVCEVEQDVWHVAF